MSREQAETLRAEADAALGRGEPAAACASLRQSLEELGTGYRDPSQVDDTELHVLAAEELSAQGRHAEAAALLRRALEERLRFEAA